MVASSRKRASQEGSPGAAKRAKSHSQKDEKTLMDQLMAGLDASMFENIVSSPVRPRSQKPSQRSPLGVKRDSFIKPQSPGKRSRPKDPIRIKVEHQPRVENIMQDDLCPPVFVPVEASPIENKAEEWDDPGFLVDFDLGDLSAFDEDLALPILPRVSLSQRILWRC